MEVRVARGADGVDLLVELDQVVVVDPLRVEGEDPQLGEALAALVDHEVAGERVDVLEPDGGVVGEQRLPVLGRRRRDRCGAELEVGSGVVVQHQQHVAAADHAVLHAVLQALATLREDPEARLGVLGVEQPDLGGGLGAGHDLHEPVGAGAADAGPEPRVGLVVDQLVVGLGGAEPVAPHLVGPPGLVDGGVEERRAVGVPGGAAEHPGDLVAGELAGAQVLDPDRVALVAGGVGRVGQQVGVGADGRAAEREELAVAGELVEVEQHLLAGQRGLVGGAVLVGGGRGPVGRVGHRDPAAGAVLASLEGAAVVPVAAVAARHRQVGLEGAGLDLAEDRLAQVGEVGGGRLGVVVLGGQVGHHLRVVLVPEPVVLVDPGTAVVGGRHRPRIGDGRGEDGLLGHARQSRVRRVSEPRAGRHRPPTIRSSTSWSSASGSGGSGTGTPTRRPAGPRRVTWWRGCCPSRGCCGCPIGFVWLGPDGEHTPVHDVRGRLPRRRSRRCASSRRPRRVRR